MKAKRCKLCGGAPKYVYYAIPEEDCPEGWFETGNGPEPYMLFKRLECSECGATVINLAMTCDDAVSAWNEQRILVKHGEEKVRDVEPYKPKEEQP